MADYLANDISSDADLQMLETDKANRRIAFHR
jgi:hypothetical protein